ncbi:hypothetical protein E4K72_19840 [Oxalobacteraceae bacterium OM1]|nr:hypothetical protein E4K72_19840 [Oxalobacteraceae bacterium OM1]
MLLPFLETTKVRRYDIRTTQELLGHADSGTTMIYFHVLNEEGRSVMSPMDHLASRRACLIKSSLGLSH